MQWIEVIIDTLLSVLSGIIFSILIFVALYLIYRIKVKNYPFDFHLRIMNGLKSRTDKKSHENRINDNLERYKTLVKRPSIMGILIPLLIVGIIGYILYTQMIFFAVISSGSMEPTFKKGDLIFMQNINIEVDEGDIIMFKTPSVLTPVTHRIVSEINNGFFTKGDARRSRDDWVVNYDQIIGKAITLNDKPIIIKDVGLYFIEELSSDEMSIRYGDEFLLMRKIIASIKSLGLVIFFFAIFMYILSSIKS